MGSRWDMPKVQVPYLLLWGTKEIQESKPDYPNGSHLSYSRRCCNVMTNEINQVKDFHEKFGIPVSGYPDYISQERQKLRIDILQEEVNELAKAMGENNMVEIADGVVDCIYILFGTAVEYGFHHKLEAMFHEIHRSNMSKLGEDGKPICREDGKVLKGPGYSPPDLGSILV